MRRSQNILAKTFNSPVNLLLYLLIPYLFVTLAWYYLGTHMLKISYFETFFYALFTYSAVVGFFLGLSQKKVIEAGFGFIAGPFGFIINVVLFLYIAIVLISALGIFLFCKVFLLLLSLLGANFNPFFDAPYDPLFGAELFMESISSKFSLIIFFLLPILSLVVYSLTAFKELNSKVLFLVLVIIFFPALPIGIPHISAQQLGYILFASICACVLPLGIFYALGECLSNSQKPKEEKVPEEGTISA